MDYKVTMTDAETEEHVWTGPVEELLDANPDFRSNIVLAVLLHPGDMVFVGGGAQAEFKVVRLD